MSRFEALPVDLLLEILETLESTGDLSSAIKSSPKLFHIFNQYRSSILKAVLARAIHPHAFYHALAVIHIPQKQESETPSAHEEEVTNFMIQYAARDEALKERMISASSVKDYMRMAKMHAIVRNLIRSYAFDTMKLLSEGPYEEDTSEVNSDVEYISCSFGDDPSDEAKAGLAKYPPVELSYREEGRLQAAFYRYEICCRLMNRQWHGDAGALIGDIVMSQLRPWEIDELCCILQYSLTTLRPLFAAMEHDLVADCQNNALNHVPVDAPLIVCNHLGAKGRRNFTMSDIAVFGTFFDTFDGRQTALRNLTMCGLRFFEEVTSPVTTVERRRNLLRCTEKNCQDHIETVLKRYQGREDLDAASPQAAVKVAEDAIQPNAFFCMYSQTDSYRRSRAMGTREAIVLQLGYVFWDYERLEELNILPVMREVLYGETEPPALDLDLFGPCAEEQLDGTVITTATFDMIVAKYGEVSADSEELPDILQSAVP